MDYFTESVIKCPKAWEKRLDFLKKVEMNASVKSADLRDTNLTNLSVSNLDLSGADLSGSVMTNSHFAHCNFSNTTLYGANLSSSSMTCCKMHHANFSGSNMFSVDLTGSDISYSSFRSCQMLEADFTHTSIKFTDLSWADLHDADLLTIYMDGVKLAKTKGIVEVGRPNGLCSFGWWYNGEPYIRIGHFHKPLEKMKSFWASKEKNVEVLAALDYFEVVAKERAKLMKTSVKLYGK